MRFSEIMRDRRGFVHKRILGAATGFLGGGGIVGAIGGFLGGGGGNGQQAPRQPRPGFLGGFLGGRPIPQPTTVPGTFAPVPTPRFAVPGPPLAFHDTGPAAPSPGGRPGDCPIFMSWDPVRQKCVIDLDPGEGVGLPGGENGRGAGLVAPVPVCIETLMCPKFADNKKGVLWMNALTGDVLCLPRGVNGSGFGLIRKNRPRRKAYVTAAEISALRKQATTKKKAKKFAALTGQTCVARGTAQRSRH